MIHVCTSDIAYMVWGNECFLLDGSVLSECQQPRARRTPIRRASFFSEVPQFMELKRPPLPKKNIAWRET